jgi:hypothetical protein
VSVGKFITTVMLRSVVTSISRKPQAATDGNWRIDVYCQTVLMMEAQLQVDSSDSG